MGQKNVIGLKVEKREITTQGEFLLPVRGNMRRDFISISLDAEWDEFARYRVTFTGSGKPVSVDWDKVADIEIPPECLEGNVIRFTVAGLDEEGTERLLTKFMNTGVKVDPNGTDNGVEPQPETPDILQRVKSLADQLEGSEDERQREFESNQEQRANDFNASQLAREETFGADQLTRESNFNEAQEARKGAFDTAYAKWVMDIAAAVAQALTASQTAENAAVAAQNSADNLTQRVEAGEFNGASFSIKFTPSSIAAMNALTSMHKGDFACIQSTPEDEDNAKLFLYTGTRWSFITDMSGAIGIKGDQGVQGVSLKGVKVVNQTQVEVTQYDPMTEQERTYVIGDFAAPLAAGIKAYVDSQFQVVDSFPANPIPGVVYMEVQ